MRDFVPTKLVIFLMLLVFATVCAAQTSSKSVEGQKKQDTQMTESTKKDTETGSKSVIGMPVRMSRIMGKTVTNRLGQELGSIADVVVGPDSEVRFIILSHGGMLGIGDKLIPIPWKTVAIDEKNNRVHVDVNKRSLERAPNFSAEEWPSFNKAEWEKKIFTYYAIPE